MFFLILTTFTILLLIHQFFLRRLNLPKGPLPLPIVGNFHQFMFEEKWEHKFLEWKEKFGAIYTMWVGIRPIITINDYETAVKLFVTEGDNYLNRPEQENFHKLTRGGVFGVGQSSGRLWQNQRRATLRILRNFGLGKNVMQERILDEFHFIYDSLNEEIKAGIQEHDVNKLIDISVGSVINSLACGYRFTTNNKQSEFEHLKHYSNDFIQKFIDPLTNIGINSNTMAQLPFIKKRLLAYKGTFDQLFKFIDTTIEEHLRHHDYEAEIFEPLDFIDAYMIEMHKANKSGKDHFYSIDNCRNIILDLWLAGQETTSNTLQWAVIYLINHPEIQQKLHDELDKIVDGDRLITVKDKPFLHYVNATILEAQRCANLAVFNIPRAVGKDVDMAGCRVEKGTMIVVQLSVIMSDPKNFPDPQEFRPERFLDAEGKFVNDEKVVAFSLGKRICIGESLGRMELFIFLSNLFNQYKFSASTTPPSLRRHLNGGMSSCIPYKAHVERRFH